ncbi:SET domain-containing protein [Tricholoma matsutake]|nr:SET domain-containing protein [Tricholoma matsutake 945]
MSSRSSSSDFSDLFGSDNEPSHLWCASESPAETFSDAEGADEDGNWRVQIIGEEVDGTGEVRYQAQWENWTRRDGSNVTWDNNFLHWRDINFWKRKQTARRNRLADESLDIEIWGTLDIHNTATRLRAQAYEEKLLKRNMTPLNHAQKMAKLLADKLPHTYGDSRAAAVPSTPGPTLRPRQTTDRSSMPGSVASSSRSSATLSSASYRTPASSFTTASASAPASAAGSSNGKGKGKAVMRPPPMRSLPPAESTTSPRPKKPLRSRARRAPTPKVSKCEKLQREWNRIAQLDQAASITFTNDVDDEEIPELDPDFQYLETGYIYSKGVMYQDDAERFVCCECEQCSFASACDCQGPSELVDGNGRKIFAYTDDRLFAFNVPPGVEVIECNAFCQCDASLCPNRVAQLPRDVPVEIFKTIDRGWGVRAPVDIEQGKVLGIYSGLLIPRRVALALSADDGSYCFDLDGREGPDMQTPDDAYSVDSRMCGNWTRFVNHSCDPNLRVYLVVFDTIPERNAPYLAFVALKDIQAGTEFTFDYSPGDAGTTTKVQGKGKGKIKIPSGAKPCMCGASHGCRGWVRV